ncbi:MAG TPA: hypothetical protein VK132_12045 [Gemmatimonadales bacterium]|nr:hypothetical protein [Gemmatimonadales bacterium]
MNRLTSLAVATALSVVAHPAVAQLQNLPVYFSPKGGTGLTISADYGQATSTKIDGIPLLNKPTALGGRVSLGLPIVTVGIGAAVYDPKVTTIANSAQYMGSAAFKVFGGPLIPIAVSLQAGVGYLSQGSGVFASKTVNVPLGVGVAVNVPTPGASIEPWAAARVHINSVTAGTASNTQTGYGLSGGVNLGLPIGVGLHAAVDWSSFPAKTSGTLNLLKRETVVLGVGLHYSIKLPGLPGVPLVPGV